MPQEQRLYRGWRHKGHPQVCYCLCVSGWVRYPHGRAWLKHGCSFVSTRPISKGDSGSRFTRSAFLGHDTATLHLAAATCTQVIGIYCARDPPGKWFLGRPGDVFFFHQPTCFGSLLLEVSECPHNRICMTATIPWRYLRRSRISSKLRKIPA